jgi:hypothetical protein
MIHLVLKIPAELMLSVENKMMQDRVPAFQIIMVILILRVDLNA